MFRTLIDIIASPSEALASIRQRPTVLFPLLLILVATASIQAGYFLTVDFDFMVDELVEQALAVSSAPEDALRAAYANSDPNNLAIVASISTALFVLVVTAIYAGWLHFAAKFGSDDFRYRHWLSLAAWTGIPALFAALAAWVVLLGASDGRISLEDVTPLSLNNLLVGAEGPFAAMLNGINLTQFWSLALVTLGYRQWTHKPWGVALGVAAAPWLLLYGIWTIVILV